MMKKLLMFCAVFMAGTAMGLAFPSIGIIGDATPTAWASDTDMTTTDGVTYTLDNFTLTAGSVKFRQDDGWDNNWGGATFPSGTGLFNSSTNIAVQPGLYNITFNLSTLAYNFESAGNFDTLTIVGGGLTFAMFTTDGIMYYSNNDTFTDASSVQFMVNGTGAGWGSTGFPTGTAVSGGSIPVPANSYNIVFNKSTGVYAFNFVTISLTGTGVQDWGIDADLSTTDGVNYWISDHTFLDGEIKFRLNHDWAVTWGGGTLPSGTMALGGGNVPITAGNYDVTFNRITGDFAFSAPTAGIADVKKGSITVYPNPSATAWNFNAGNDTINTMQIVDVTGKIVYSAAVNASAATVNAGGLSAGIYFARLTSGNAVQTIRVVKN